MYLSLGESSANIRVGRAATRGLGLLFALALTGVLLFAFSVQAACSNPSPLPSGYAAPCPVFSVSPASLAPSGTLTLTATPQPGTDYIYTTAYYAKGSTWLPVTLTGNNVAPSYSSGPATGSLSSSILSQLTPGTNYLVLWDWLWDAAAGCYKGPGPNQCNTGTWRLQMFTLTQSTSGPAVSISPTTLTFPATQVGTTSAVQYATLTNAGNAALTFSSTFTFSGDFGFGGSGTCSLGVSYAPGTSCTAGIVFTPTAAGIRTGTLTINSNAANTPQIISLSGTGALASPTPTPSTSPIGCTSGCNDYYVSPSGSDSNPCTQTAPCASLSRANTVATVGTSGTCTAASGWLSEPGAGACIHVAPGTYNGGEVVLSKAGVSASQKIVWMSDTKWGAQIRFTGSGSSILVAVAGPYVDVAGFDVSSAVTTADTANYAMEVYGTGGHVHFIGNRIHDFALGVCTDNGGAAIASSPNFANQPDIEAIGNYVYNEGGPNREGTCRTFQGIYVHSPSPIFQNNIVTGVPNGGIACVDECDNGIITNNTIVFAGGYGNGNGPWVGTSPPVCCQSGTGSNDDVGGGIGLGGITFSTQNHNNVSNNLIMNTGAGAAGGPSGYACAIQLGLSRGPLTNSYVKNNLVWDVRTGDNRTTPVCDNTTVSYIGPNLNANGTVVVGTMNVDPLLVNPAPSGIGDYHLKTGSPAIGAGTITCTPGGPATCIPATDFDGNPRTGAITIGAYEQ